MYFWRVNSLHISPQPQTILTAHFASFASRSWLFGKQAGLACLLAKKRPCRCIYGYTLSRELTNCTRQDGFWFTEGDMQ